MFLPREPHSSYTSIPTYLSLKTLEQRHLLLDLYFSYELLIGDIDCPAPDFSFHILARNTRSINIFYDYYIMK